MNIRRHRAHLRANLCASDNGSAFVDAALKRAAARLGIKITHSQPGRPQGRGKIERFFGVVRQEFL
ncbi:MAG: integrase core domain-containing protein, partial [Streptosporangiaceae bacterium]